MKSKAIVGIILLVIAIAASVFVATLLPASVRPIIRSLVLMVLAVGSAKIVFMILERMYPEPENLSIADVKDFVRSKVFWLAVLNLVVVASKELFQVEIDEDTKMQVLNMDWSGSGLIQALISVALIIIRRYGILKAIR